MYSFLAIIYRIEQFTLHIWRCSLLHPKIHFSQELHDVMYLATGNQDGVSQKVFWLKKSLNQYLSIPTVQCGHWAAIIFISDIGQQSATLSLVTHHLLAEDLVLGEERTSKKDRQRIMEGEYLLCLFIILFVVMNDAGLVNTVIVFSSESSRGGEKKSSIRRGRAESSVRFLYPHKNII